jgi:hypothetical protein
MYCHYSPWFFCPFWTLLCGVYRPHGLISFANFIIVVLLWSVWQCLFSNVPVSYEWDIKDCVMFECLCCTWWGFNILWYVLQIAHAALLMNVSMSAGSSELTMSISEVHIIIWWMHLLMTIALRILNLGWLTYYAIAFAYDSMCNLKSDPLSYMKWWLSGCLHNQIFVN